MREGSYSSYQNRDRKGSFGGTSYAMQNTAVLVETAEPFFWGARKTTLAWRRRELTANTSWKLADLSRKDASMRQLGRREPGPRCNEKFRRPAGKVQ